MSAFSKVDIINVNNEALKKPIVTKFWSPVKECNCTVKIESVSENEHWLTFRYYDRLKRKWVSEQCKWKTLDDAMQDMTTQVRVWSTEVYHAKE